MAKTTSKSAFFEKYQKELEKGHEQHKNDETDYGGGGDLPQGINNGIAQLVECKFDTYKSGKYEGEYYFLAAGVVQRPVSVKGFGKVAGLRTQIMEPMCETPGKKRSTIPDHTGWLLNFFRQFGVDTSKGIHPKQYEAIAAGLRKNRPFFRFRTWVGQKQELEEKDGFFFVGDKKYKSEAAAKKANPYLGMDPLVNHTWRGKCEEPEDDEDTPASADAPGLEVDGDVDVEEPDGEEEVEGAEEVDEEEEYDETGLPDEPLELAELADAGDDNAGAKLQRLALEAGIDISDINSTESWSEVVTLIEDSGEGAESEDEEEEEGPDFDALGEEADQGIDDAIETLEELAAEAGLNPDSYPTWIGLAKALQEGEEVDEEEGGESFSKGDVLDFKPKLQSGKLSARSVQAKITAVNDDGTYNVRNLATNKIVKNVDEEQLSETE